MLRFEGNWCPTIKMYTPNFFQTNLFFPQYKFCANKKCITYSTEIYVRLVLVRCEPNLMENN